jgi:hypothetical protein
LPLIKNRLMCSHGTIQMRAIKRRLPIINEPALDPVKIHSHTRSPYTRLPARPDLAQALGCAWIFLTTRKTGNAAATFSNSAIGAFNHTRL